MSELYPSRLRSRTPGRVAIERSTRLLLIRAHRTLNGRPLSDADRRWLGRLLDRLTDVLAHHERKDPDS